MIKPLIIGAVIGAVIGWLMAGSKGANVNGITGAPNVPYQAAL